MRTTIRLDDVVLREAKAYAAHRGMTLTAVIDAAIRRLLTEADRSEPAPIELPLYGTGGVRPGVDLDNNAALLDLMEC